MISRIAICAFIACIVLCVGAPTALAVSQLIGSFLFKMKPNDPTVLATAPMVLIGATFLAGYTPARKASRINPTIAMRSE